MSKYIYLIFLSSLLVFSSCSSNKNDTSGLSKKEKIEKLIEVIELEDQYDEIMGNMTETLFNQVDSDRRAIVQEWFNKYFSFSEVKDEMMDFYSTNLSEEAIDAGINFYSTKKGQEFIKMQSKASNHFRNVFEERAKDHQQELIEMLQN